MSGALSFADIKKEFDESLGYIRGDIKWLCEHNSGLNYTVALLVGCGCEMVAACRGDRKHPERVLAELLPSGDWRVLANRLHTALRDGLAHGFDTKHLHVDGQTIQIHISWRDKEAAGIYKIGGTLTFYIGVQALAKGICAKIDELEETLQSDEEARKAFIKACEHDRLAPLSRNEAEAWRRLVAAADS
jgi:hypothetical protein